MAPYVFNSAGKMLHYWERKSLFGSVDKRPCAIGFGKKTVRVQLKRETQGKKD